MRFKHALDLVRNPIFDVLKRFTTGMKLDLLRSCQCSLNQKLVLPRYAYFTVPGSLQRYSLRGNSTELHVPLPKVSAAGEALLAHHLVSSAPSMLHVHAVVNERS